MKLMERHRPPYYTRTASLYCLLLLLVCVRSVVFAGDATATNVWFSAERVGDAALATPFSRARENAVAV